MSIRKIFTRLRAEPAIEKNDQNQPSHTRAALFALGLLSLVLGAVIFLITALVQEGVFFSHLDYSGHGFWGWSALFCSCVLNGGIISILVLRLLRLTPLRKPKWQYFVSAIITLGFLLFGLARHSHGPIIADMGLAALTCATLLYCFYDVPSSKLGNK